MYVRVIARLRCDVFLRHGVDSCALQIFLLTYLLTYLLKQTQLIKAAPLKPNSITPASSELASVTEFGFY